MVIGEVKDSKDDIMPECFSENDLNDDKLPQNLLKDLKDDCIQIVTVVEKLGPTLTSPKPEIRVRAISLLTGIIADLPYDFFSEVQLHFIATFYVDRLKDHHQIIPSVLEGLLKIIDLKHFPNDIPVKLITELFKHVTCQQQTQRDRYNIYLLFQKLFTNHIEDVKMMGFDFVLGFIQSIDGERDPRNLIFLFSILPSFLKNLNLGDLTEVTFDVIACYFPVDFNAPQDDAKGITRNELADKLCICLCAVPSFAEYCIPLLLEKLDSDSHVAKIDSLKLLKESCSVFLPKSFESHLSEIWKIIQKEIYRTDAQIIECSHQALSTLIFTLSTNDEDVLLETFLKNIFVTIQCQLVDTNTKLLFDSLMKIYLCVAKSSEKSCIFIIKNSIPLISAYYKTTAEESIKIGSLDYFKAICEICKHWNLISVCSDDLKVIKIVVLPIINTDTEIKLKLSALSTLSVIAEVISPTEALMLQDVFNYNINHEVSQELFDANKNCLMFIAKHNSESYNNFINDLFILDSVISCDTLLSRKIHILCSLASIDNFTDNIITNLLNILSDKNIKLSTNILRILSFSLKNANLYSSKNIQEIQCKYNLIEFLIKWVLNKKICNEFSILINASDIIITIMRDLNSDIQNNIILQILPLYINEFLQGDHSIIILQEGLLNSTRSDIIFDGIERILARSFNIALNENVPIIQHKALMLLINILNKYIRFDNVNEQYNMIKNELISLFNESEEDKVVYMNGILLISWLSKSFLHNGHCDGMFWLSKIISFLNNDSWGMEAAKGIKIIMEDNQDVLNKICFCKVNIFYKQKVFLRFLQCISDDTDLQNQNLSYFLSWTYILESIPKSVLIMELEKLSVIIIKCLDLNDPDVLLIILDILSYLIQNNKFIGSVQTLLPRCLKLCKQEYNMKIRIASLKCVFNIAECYSTFQLLPHKQDTVMDIASCLDDPKRIVRNMAVKARTRWYLVGSPGENKNE